MKLTRTQVMVGTGVVALIAIICLIIHFAAPKDTPIVAGGGSIYGETASTDTDGWKPVSNLNEYASLHASISKNPYGIDLLTFTNFDTDPGYVVTGTGGWAIQIRDPLPPGTPGSPPNLTPAVQFCSDPTCSAATASCVQFNSSGPVYFNVRPTNAQLNPLVGGGPGGATQMVNFHDTTSDCNSPVANACDKVFDVKLFTCKGGTNPVFTLTCNNNPTKCQVQVGR